jgi:hypothetical protein
MMRGVMLNGIRVELTELGPNSLQRKAMGS